MSSDHLVDIENLNEEAKDFLVDFKSRFSLDDIKAFLNDISELRALVLGEVIIDVYQYCEAIGKSSKEPVLAVKQLSNETFAGGALALANHVANFSNHTSMLSFVGRGDNYKSFISESLNSKIDTYLLEHSVAPTIVKKRYIEGYFFEKLFEVYEMNDSPMPDEDNGALCSKLDELISEQDVVIVLDFGHGLMTSEAVKLVSEKARFLAVNTQANAGNFGYNTISKYPKVDYASLNESEVRLETRQRRADLEGLVERVAKKIGCKRMTITRGKYGNYCYGIDEGVCVVPSLADRIVDRVGAGDSLLSITSLGAAIGAPMELVGFVGNIIGARSVATVGHRSTVDKKTLLSFAETLLR